MLHGIAASAVTSRIPQLSRTTWIRRANHPSVQPTRRSYIPNSQVFSRIATRVTHRNHTSSSIPPKSGRLSRTSRRLTYIGLGLGLAWYLDKEFYASTVSRNLRTLWIVRVFRNLLHSPRFTRASTQYSLIALDYKINFTPENSEGIPAIHERVAERLFNLVTSNGGLYIKIGTSPPIEHY